MKIYFKPDVSEDCFGFTKLTHKIITRYIGIMYESAADYSDDSVWREYHYLRDSGNLQELFEDIGTVGLIQKLIKNYLGNMYEEAADYSDESVRREYDYLNDNGRLHELFECDWVFSNDRWAD